MRISITLLIAMTVLPLYARTFHFTEPLPELKARYLLSITNEVVVPWDDIAVSRTAMGAFLWGIAGTGIGTGVGAIGGMLIAAQFASGWNGLWYMAAGVCFGSVGGAFLGSSIGASVLASKYYGFQPSATLFSILFSAALGAVPFGMYYVALSSEIRMDSTLRMIVYSVAIFAGMLLPPVGAYLGYHVGLFGATGRKSAAAAYSCLPGGVHYGSRMRSMPDVAFAMEIVRW